MKIVINTRPGGFDLSDKALKMYHVATQTKVHAWEIERDDTVLVGIVNHLGKQADGPYANLKIIEVPDNIEYYIMEDFGVETIHECHRTWGDTTT